LQEREENCSILQGTKLLLWELEDTGNINSTTFIDGTDAVYGKYISHTPLWKESFSETESYT
jgi:hypothetical protein